LLAIHERGVEATLVFTLKETAKTNKINISYKVEGREVICDLRLSKNKVILHQATVKGSSDELNQLVKKIIDEVVPHAK